MTASATTRFEMFLRLHEPEHGWANREDALRAFDAWEATTKGADR